MHWLRSQHNCSRMKLFLKFCRIFFTLLEWVVVAVICWTLILLTFLRAIELFGLIEALVICISAFSLGSVFLILSSMLRGL